MHAADARGERRPPFGGGPPCAGRGGGCRPGGFQRTDGPRPGDRDAPRENRRIPLGAPARTDVRSAQPRPGGGSHAPPPDLRSPIRKESPRHCRAHLEADPPGAAQAQRRRPLLAAAARSSGSQAQEAGNRRIYLRGLREGCGMVLESDRRRRGRRDTLREPQRRTAAPGPLPPGARGRGQVHRAEAVLGEGLLPPGARAGEAQPPGGGGGSAQETRRDGVPGP
mmetsp:Transcript_25356/g.47331  ORF Transcript_25356/g.47331 Transcript_25356/m.47331 type:complete len:224 (-) Transcript_25356:478-1149(-)